MTMTPATLSLSARWERADVDRDGDETGLLIHIAASSGPTASAHRAPLDIAFALDRSGSMHGPDKIDLVKEAVIAATDHLDDEDRVALVSFDHEVEVRHELTFANGAGKRRLSRMLADVEARGSTNLSGGWLTACQQLAAVQRPDGPLRLQRALLLTDGLANQGITEPGELVRHATELRRRGIETTTIGVGRHFDEMLLSGMAEAGGGAFEYIAETSQLRSFFEQEIGDLLQARALRPVLRVTFPDGVRGRLVSAFPVDRHGKTVIVDLRSLSAGETVDLVFDISVRAGARPDDTAPMVELEWLQATTGERSGMHQELPALRLVDTDAARGAVRDDEVAEIIAKARADRDQREAIRLDREGRFRESRAMFHQSAVRLAEAPQTDAVQAEYARAMTFAKKDMRPLDEHTRKQRVYESLARSRGQRRDRS